MINPKKELFKWGPIDGRPAYIDTFIQAFIPYPKIMKAGWSDTVGYFKEDKIFFVLEDEKLRDKGEILFTYYVLDDTKLKKSYDRWLKSAKKLLTFEKNLDFEKLNDKEFGKLLIEWDVAYGDFWLNGFLPELANWGGERILKEKLKGYSEGEFIEIFEKLSAPEDLSFFQKEELEFLKLKFKGSLLNHQKKYYWLRNNYCHTKVLDVSFFKKELDRISKERAKNRINEISNYIKEVQVTKKNVITKHKVLGNVVKVGEKLAYCVWWQDYRKKFVFIANHIITLFLKEISRRHKVNFKELCYYTTPELKRLVQTGVKVDTKDRIKGFVEYYHENGDVMYLVGKDAVDFMEPYVHEEVVNDKVVKGMVVSKGNIVRSKVKILMTPRNLNKMKDGDVLVTSMTSPDFVVAMRKASAIVTDVGGMTSHAAIVSRELKVPCIVGTKVATKVFKDGDLVEVNTNTGVVRKC